MKFIKKIKMFFKKCWNWVWSKTTIDEKAKSTIEKIDKRLDRVKEESKDVVEAVKDVGSQVKDVVSAAKGSTKRRGRPRKNEKKA